jgi:hypothetical protein
LNTGIAPCNDNVPVGNRSDFRGGALWQFVQYLRHHAGDSVVATPQRTRINDKMLLH